MANRIKQQSVKAIALFSTSLIHDYVDFRTESVFKLRCTLVRIILDYF